MKTKDQLQAELTEFLKELHDQPRHQGTSTHCRIDRSSDDYWQITILVENPNSQMLLEALAFVQRAHAFFSAFVYVHGNVCTPQVAKRRRLRDVIWGLVR